MSTFNKYLYIITLILGECSLQGCKKLIEIAPPQSSVIASQVFSSNKEADAAIMGIYGNMINNALLTIGNGAITAYCGMSADELTAAIQTDLNTAQFQFNGLLSTNAIIQSSFWSQAYYNIYTANAIIENLTKNDIIDDSIRNEITGEAKFVRAFEYFYLTNLFGDVPLVTTINYNKTNLLSRTPVAQVYDQIKADLLEADAKLSSDYKKSQGMRTRPNKWAAKALLARVYLYLKDWKNAENESTLLINNTNLFNLANSVETVFDRNSTEAIWQLDLNTNQYPFNATPEGANFIPRDTDAVPIAFITQQQLSAFETGDHRKDIWVGSYIHEGVIYYFPRKYNIGPADAKPGGLAIQLYSVLRLSEIYLIRAEAETQSQDPTSALNDLNALRNRALLTTLTGLSQSETLEAVYKERQTELFAEWGHRWLDLKRTQRAGATLSPIKPQWSNNDQLYPIPVGELQTDPNLTQNPGY